MVTLVRSAVSPERGERVALAVSLDIANVFNSLPWTKIRQNLFRYNVYIRRVIGDCLLERSVIYCMGKDQALTRREIFKGVPQKSVLGPLLWNLDFDLVLSAAVPNGVHTVCYANGTLLIAIGRSWARTL